jgi:hypothetical protein
MKAQLAISVLLMAYSTTGAFAQNTDVKITLPKRERNLKNWYTDPAQIQVFRSAPTVNVFPGNQPDNSLYIRVPNVSGRQPGKTVIAVPADQFEPSNAHNPKNGNFESNVAITPRQAPNLPPGQSSRVLSPNQYFNPSKPQPGLAAKPRISAPQADSGSNHRQSSESTTLKYKPADSPFLDGTSGMSSMRVDTTVNGKKLKPGSLINAQK